MVDHQHIKLAEQRFERLLLPHAPADRFHLQWCAVVIQHQVLVAMAKGHRLCPLAVQLQQQGPAEAAASAGHAAAQASQWGHHR